MFLDTITKEFYYKIFLTVFLILIVRNGGVNYCSFSYKLIKQCVYFQYFHCTQ
jgi:hypothetical protein